MPYDLSGRLVIGLASSALFDLSKSDKVFRMQGETAYRQYQKDNEHKPLEPGVAFAFIKKLLAINHINPENPPIEVILLSRNDPDTGLRVMKSIEFYQLGIARALFLQGKSPYRFIPTLGIDLFLSANQTDVEEAILANYPAGQVLKSYTGDELLGDAQLRVALDFDGVIVDDEAEKIYRHDSLDAFHAHEQTQATKAHNAGPLFSFLKKLSDIQKQEEAFVKQHPTYQPKLRLVIVTARSAPAYERVIHTLRAYQITVNEAFFLGGIDKSKVLSVINPHIFFDDQLTHLNLAKIITPSVHIPFGIANQIVLKDKL